MKTIQEVIEKIQKEDKTIPPLPTCLGPCDECEYREEYWKERLSQEGFNDQEINDYLY